MNPSFHDLQLDLLEDSQAAPSSGPSPHNITVEYAERQILKRERNFLHYLSTLIYKSEFVDRLALATSLDAAALLTIQAIYHDPKRAEWTTQEYIAYHILVTWYASVSHTQVEKLCKLREVYYAMGYDKDFEMYLADSKFELPWMKKGGNNGQNTVGKRILDANGDQNTQNFTNSGEEQLIAFGEATIEYVDMGTDKNSRTVTFELSQAKSGKSSLLATPPSLVSSE